MIRFGFLSTYPPTRCGLATFTDALATVIVEGGHPTPVIVRALGAIDESTVGAAQAVAAPADGAGGSYPVTADLIEGDRASITEAAATLNTCDVAIVQHEYGIYGGPDGEDVVQVMDQVRVPAIVVLHTVLPDPSDHQRRVLEQVCERASAVVVMTAAAFDILEAGYEVDRTRVSVIPHGFASWIGGAGRREHRRHRVLTWGLIGPGKGLEWGIRAMAQLGDLDPSPEYIVAGQTHPKVLAQEGDAYRNRLAALVTELGLSETVTLDDRYYDGPQLAALLASVDCVLLPYDSRVQVTSGVMVEALAAGIPVVATAFPHAIELLGHGAGIVVEHENPTAMADALRTILTSPGIAAGMSHAAAATAGSLSWSAVAELYRRLAIELLTAEAA